MTQQAVSILDTTLRDGEQGEGISFTVKDKLKITQLLDNLGVQYIEGGWPGSNPKAVEYFNQVKTLPLKHAKIAAFGSTRRAKNTPENDPNLQALIKAETPVVVIFGKTWDFHVTHALKISLEENLALIYDSVAFLKSHGREVIFDSEHFFDGFKRNPEYALKAVCAAYEGGADILCLCDTNGGSLPSDIQAATQAVCQKFDRMVGIHAHNDGGMGTAISIAAVDGGARHVQGTLNGYGERCGNANLSTIIPNLLVKKGLSCISYDHLKELTPISRHLDEIANISHNDFLPYVGRSAFAHKAGVHVSAVLKHPETYEHIDPTLVGNSQRILVSELSGVSNLLYKAQEYGISVSADSSQLPLLLKEIKAMENAGYQFEEAEASFELLMKRFLEDFKPIIELQSYRVITEKHGDDKSLLEATIKAKIAGKLVHIVGEGNGPVSSLDHALRRSLEPIFHAIKNVHLVDYKVRVLNSKDGTDAKVRVLIESTDGTRSWGTVGVSENVIEASWKALVDSFEYKLLGEPEL